MICQDRLGTNMMKKIETKRGEEEKKRGVGGEALVPVRTSIFRSVIGEVEESDERLQKRVLF
jgi:hypothetical protein